MHLVSASQRRDADLFLGTGAAIAQFMALLGFERLPDRLRDPLASSDHGVGVFAHRECNSRKEMFQHLFGSLEWGASQKRADSPGRPLRQPLLPPH